MRIRKAVLMTIGVAGLVAASACGNATAPGTSAGGGGGGQVGSVTVGSGIEFVSGHNGSRNPAVDTIPAGTAVTWSWSGALPHSVQSIGSTTFTSSGTKTGHGTYAVTFTAPGTYRYDCGVHGQEMTGTIVVQ